MSNILNTILSVTEPKFTNVIWVQPQEDNTYKSFIFDGGWKEISSSNVDKDSENKYETLIVGNKNQSDAFLKQPKDIFKKGVLLWSDFTPSKITTINKVKVGPLKAKNPNTTVNYSLYQISYNKNQSFSDGIIKGRFEDIIDTLFDYGTPIDEGELQLDTEYKEYEILFSYREFNPVLKFVLFIYSYNPLNEFSVASSDVSNLQNIEYNNGVFAESPYPLKQSFWNIQGYNPLPKLMVLRDDGIVYKPLLNKVVDTKINKGVPKVVENFNKEGIDIILPSKLYTFSSGKSLQIYNDNIILSPDRGLLSCPYNIEYKIKQLGKITDRGYIFNSTDTNKEIINHIEVFDSNNRNLKSKDFTIIDLGNLNSVSNKKVLLMGDDFMLRNYEDIMGRLFHTINNIGKVNNITYIGKKGNRDLRHEFIEGPPDDYFFKDTTDKVKFKMDSTLEINMSSILITDTGTSIQITNIESEGGDLLITGNASGYMSFPSGMIRIADIYGEVSEYHSYWDAGNVYNNPFLRSSDGYFSFDSYMKNLALEGEKLDAVFIHFSSSVGNLKSSELLVNFKKLEAIYNSFKSHNPNGKFIIGLPQYPSSIGDLTPNMGIYDKLKYKNNIKTWISYILYTFDNVRYPNVLIAPIGTCFDRYYGYDYSQILIENIDQEPYARMSNSSYNLALSAEGSIIVSNIMANYLTIALTS